MDNRTLALAACRALGVAPVLLQDEPADLAVVGLGSGIVMAACDSLRSQYDGLRLLAVDLPGGIGMDRRVMALDYLANAFPTLALLYASLTDACAWPDALAQRGFQVRPECPLWVVVRGDRAIEAAQAWRQMGATTLYSPWQAHLLGNWRPNRPGRFAVLPIAASLYD